MKDTYQEVREKLPYATVDSTGFLRWDTGDNDPKEQHGWFTALCEELDDIGWELHEGSYDHDTVWGYVRPKK